MSNAIPAGLVGLDGDAFVAEEHGSPGGLHESPDAYAASPCGGRSAVLGRIGDGFRVAVAGRPVPSES